MMHDFGVYFDKVKLAITMTRKNWLPFFRFNLLFLTLTVITNYIAALVTMKLTYKRDIQEIMLTFAILPVTSYLVGGFIYYYVCFVRGISNTTNQIFRGYRWYLSILCYNIFVFSLYWIFGHPLGEFGNVSTVFQIRLVLGFMIGSSCFILSICVLPLVVDQNQSFLKSLRESARLTYHRFWLTLWLILLNFSMLLPSVLLAGLAIVFIVFTSVSFVYLLPLYVVTVIVFIFTMPIFTLSYIYFYDIYLEKKGAQKKIK